ncbi:heme ABC transporter ATP-binding protein [Paracoccus sp. Z330]|uniref:Heme ABC transporter ATP-binding protein n=1 Tax=Paracoccus onchidii TaxID=3017813 RepID=A0ABT4ZEB2_9RHOB|nr:heme ABC transporter ATP-binding protein [Paracoccus onchidii]MDB6177681.1 heme ABC transporter ATP-binding protein [Paracoccus onchidii]
MTLTARDIRVSLGRKQVPHGVDLNAEAGSVTAIVGPNGSGKTTLLRAITDEVPCLGQVMVEGLDIATAPGWQLAARRAVLPQMATLAFPFTVLEVVRMGLMSGGHGQDPSLPSRALAEVGLAGYEGRFFQELSGGEQQRAHLARVLVQVWAPVGQDGPRWLFLDEPVAALDIAHQLEVMDIVTRYARAGGGVIAVMHDLNLTALHADHVAIMSAGRIAAAGPPDLVMTDATLSKVYGCKLRVGVAPEGPRPFLLPHCAALA